jgi:hypothetical protein
MYQMFLIGEREKKYDLVWLVTAKERFTIHLITAFEGIINQLIFEMGFHSDHAVIEETENCSGFVHQSAQLIHFYCCFQVRSNSY